MNPIININITSNNNLINKPKNNNTLLKSTGTNFNNNNKSIIKKEKIQIDANKKEEDEKEINIRNNIKNATGSRIHKSMDRYSIFNKKGKKGGYRLKSKGKLFKKNDK